MKSLTISLLVFSNLAFAKAGGISGGGGNVINPTAPKYSQDPREVRAIIRGSTQLLLKFLYAKYALFKAGSMDYENIKLYSEFFEEDDEICEITKEIKIDIPLDKGCFDSQGNEFDGSSFNPKERTICISAYRIAKSTDKYEIPVQSAALIMHEYSEALGLSDEDATIIQKQVLNELKSW